MRIAIDPGVHDFSLSAFPALGDRLLFAGFFKIAPTGGPDELGLALDWWLKGRPERVKELAIERPKFRREKGIDQQDILDLSAAMGALASVARCHGAILVRRFFPEDWKGQIPKPVTKARVDRELSPEEMARVEWPAAHLRHNVYDAIHIGLRIFTKRKV